MQALTVAPGVPGSLRLEDRAEPSPDEGPVLVRMQALGLCGTDFEIVEGKYGSAPPGHERLILGHESVGRIVEAPAGSGLARGDWVVAFVRHPDPVPCASCAVGEWDMCRNGQYAEHGIKELDGFGRDYYRTWPESLVKVGPELAELGVLVEPASVIAKAWEHAERIGRRASYNPRRVLVTGAGPIGLLAALFGVQRRLDVHVLDRATEGRKPELVRRLGASYTAGDDLQQMGENWDLIFECTGAPSLLFQAMDAAAPDGIVCLTGVSSGGKHISVDPGALNRELVLENKVVFGSVNANRRHYESAVQCLKETDRGLLERLVTERVPIAEFQRAFAPTTDGIKTIVTFDAE
jgi:threonine dehydrogenase-like Zn-dependent dehydrogenase